MFWYFLYIWNHYFNIINCIKEAFLFLTGTLRPRDGLIVRTPYSHGNVLVSQYLSRKPTSVFSIHWVSEVLRLLLVRRMIGCLLLGGQCITSEFILLEDLFQSLFLALRKHWRVLLFCSDASMTSGRPETQNNALGLLARLVCFQKPLPFALLFNEGLLHSRVNGH